MTVDQTELTNDAATTAKTLRARVPADGRRAKTRGATRLKTEPELLAEISAKLDRVIAVLAAQGKDRDTQAAILAQANCDSIFIGSVVGMSPGAVRKLPGWRRSQGDVTDDESKSSL